MENTTAAINDNRGGVCRFIRRCNDGTFEATTDGVQFEKISKFTADVSENGRLTVNGIETGVSIKPVQWEE